MTGSIDRSLDQAKSKSVKKRQNLTLSKEKISRNPSQKNQILVANNPNFFFSRVGQ